MLRAACRPGALKSALGHPSDFAVRARAPPARRRSRSTGHGGNARLVGETGKAASFGGVAVVDSPGSETSRERFQESELVRTRLEIGREKNGGSGEKSRLPRFRPRRKGGSRRRTSSRFRRGSVRRSSRRASSRERSSGLALRSARRRTALGRIEAARRSSSVRARTRATGASGRPGLRSSG